MYPELELAIEQVRAAVYAIAGNERAEIGKKLRDILAIAQPHELHYLISAVADELDPVEAEDVTLFESLPNKGACEI